MIIKETEHGTEFVPAELRIVTPAHAACGLKIEAYDSLEEGLVLITHMDYSPLRALNAALTEGVRRVTIY